MKFNQSWVKGRLEDFGRMRIYAVDHYVRGGREWHGMNAAIAIKAFSPQRFFEMHFLRIAFSSGMSAFQSGYP